MHAIDVHRYPVPTDEERAAWPPEVHAPADRWEGWIEPEDLSWIVFVAVSGPPLLFTRRDPQTGAVLDDDPAWS